MPSDTLRLRACVAPYVHGGVAGDAELSFSCWRMCASSALRSSALLGMQPTLRQTPPQYFFSITRGLQAELRGADGSDVAAGSGAEDEDIEVLAHGASLVRRAGVRCQRGIGSDRDELDGADGVARQHGAGDLRVGAERLGHRDGAGLEGELGGPVVQEARARGTATRRRCGAGPGARNEPHGLTGGRRASPRRRRRSTGQPVLVAPQPGQPVDRLGGQRRRRCRRRPAPGRRARAPARRPAPRAAGGRARRGTTVSRPSTFVARICSPSWRAAAAATTLGTSTLAW